MQDSFRSMVRAEGTRLYRDLPWRRTRDAYAIWVSEVMLQQTQVARVKGRWETWMDMFPSVFALAEAPASAVLAAWQGMGYNRRALALHKAARLVAEQYSGIFPQDAHELCTLPGIGPATAQGIRSFAFDLPGVYLETNVRTVFLHHYFPDVASVPDSELIPLVKASCPGAETPFAPLMDVTDTPRSWYFALLDYGAVLKQVVSNPARRSAAYVRQSRFEGSHRQKRAALLRFLLDAKEAGLGLEEAVSLLNAVEGQAGRPAVEGKLVENILNELAAEGFCRKQKDRWHIA